MTESRKTVLKETGIVLLGEAVATGSMFLVYVLLAKFSVSVLFSGLLGMLLAVANFFSMAIAVTLAADKAENQDVEGGKKLIKSSYPVRIIALAAVLILCGRSAYFDVLALVLPLLFVRPTLMVAEFFKKKGS